MAYNSLHKLRDNIRAIRLALAWQKGNALSPEEVSRLQGYCGFGGIKAVLFPVVSKELWMANGATKADLWLYHNNKQAR